MSPLDDFLYQYFKVPLFLKVVFFKCNYNVMYQNLVILLKTYEPNFFKNT